MEAAEAAERTLRERFALYKSNPEIINYLSNIVGAQIPIRDIKDMNRAFELDNQKNMGKTIMIWDK